MFIGKNFIIKYLIIKQRVFHKCQNNLKFCGFQKKEKEKDELSSIASQLNGIIILSCDFIDIAMKKLYSYSHCHKS